MNLLEQRIVKDVQALCNDKFAGNYATMFAQFDADQDGKLDRGEIMQALAAAGYGPLWMSALAADAVIAKIGSGGGVTLAQFEAAANNPPS